PGRGVLAQRPDLPALDPGVVEGGLDQLAGDPPPSDRLGYPGMGDVHDPVDHLVVDAGLVALHGGHEAPGNGMVGDVEIGHGRALFRIAAVFALALVAAVARRTAAVDGGHPRLALVQPERL